MTFIVTNIQDHRITSPIQLHKRETFISLLHSSASVYTPYWQDKEQIELKKAYKEAGFFGEVVVAFDSAAYYGTTNMDRFSVAVFDGETLRRNPNTMHTKFERKDPLRVIACDVLRQFDSLDATVMTREQKKLIHAGLTI